jgi:bacterioferritin
MLKPQNQTYRSNTVPASRLTDTRTLRERARQGLADGAVTAGYGPLRDEVLALLDSALATELVCMLRYRRHHFMARGVLSKPVADEFLLHATQELEHADWLAERIVQLGGAPDFEPVGLTARSHAQYIEGQSLADMIRENLVAERIAIDAYRECIAFLGDSDPTTRRLLETILATEEEHADELATLLQEVPAAPLLLQAPAAPASSNGQHGGNGADAQIQ